MEKIGVTICGAGVIGLAAALELSKDFKDVFVIEKNSSFGQETSSRNSEVIHAGIYYPKSSLKTKTCVEGRPLLYDFCLKNNIAHKKIGKLIVAINNDEIIDLENLLARGLDNGVEDLKFVSKSEMKKTEPHVEAQAAIFSPSTGIIDSHGFMKSLVSQFEASGGKIVYNTEMIGVDKVGGGFQVTVKDKEGGIFKFGTRVFINSSGLNSDKVAVMVGIRKDEYKLKYCKGDYFRVSSSKSKLINKLIYPVPKKNRAGLGIHATLDLAGSLRLGPDDEYTDKMDYEVDASKRAAFHKGVSSFLPFILQQELYPDTSGIRPKLQGPGEDFRDFIISDEGGDGFSGFINLIGIESPGLTGALSIAKIVKKIVDNIT